MVHYSFGEVKDLLTEYGLKGTHPRIVVLRELMEQGGHPSAEILFEAVKKDNPSISLGTVYRVLEKLIEVNLVNLVATRNGTRRYDANLKPHMHIYCSNTHQIEDYHDDELHELISNYFQKKQIKNFRISEVKLQINGVKDNPDDSVTIV